MNVKTMTFALTQLEDTDLDKLHKSITKEQEYRYKKRVEDAQREARELLSLRGLRLYDALSPRLKAKVKKNAQGWDYV